MKGSCVVSGDADGSPRVILEGVPVFCRYDVIREVGDLRENPLNPNRHPDSQIERLAEVIRRSGWRAPVTVSALSGLIVKGHGRLRAALLAGWRCVPVEVQHYASRAQEEADLLADNRLAELSEVDGAALAEALRVLEGEDPAFLGLTGFSEEEIGLILNRADEGEDAPEVVEGDGEGAGDCLKFNGRVIPLSEAEGRRFSLFLDAFMARNGGHEGAVLELLVRGGRRYLDI